MYIDTHCHLNFTAYQNDWWEVLEESLRNHVAMIIVGVDRQTSEKAVEIADKYSNVWATVGLHPIHVGDRDWRSEVQHIRALAKEKKVAGIGEIGLDYYRLSKESQGRKEQEAVFQFFLDIAKEVHKPVMLHCRDSEEEFLEIMRKNSLGVPYSKSGLASASPLRPSSSEASDSVGHHLASSKLVTNPMSHVTKLTGQWHCFSGNHDQARQAIELGLTLGFTGLITYNHEWDELITKISLGHIVSETDAPYLTPVPHRGKRNEPSYVKLVAQRIAELKKLSIQEVERAVYDNAQNLYKLG